MKTPSLASALWLGLALLGCGDDSLTGGAGASGGGGESAGGAPSTGGAGGGGGQGEGGWDARFDPLVEQLLADLQASNALGVSVAIMEGGEVTFARAFGSKDAEGLAPLEPDTLMQIGSTTKQLTAAALLRKVEAGDVALDDSLEDVLPSLEFTLDPEWDDQLLVRHLISHQGGVYDLTDWGGEETDEALASYSYGTFADEVFFMSPPGSFWNYSNPNFALAGLVTEELDTRAWPEIMGEDLFDPLGMSRTFLRRSEVEADGNFAASYGYTPADLDSSFPSQGVVPLDDVADPGWLRPAGLAWTTPTQMMRWADFLLRGNSQVLSDTLRAEITAEQVDTLYQSGSLHYGYGMFVSRGFLTLDGVYYPTLVWDHGGNTLSFTNLFYVLPEHDFAIAICSSAYGTDFNRSVDVAITSLLDLPDPVEAPAYQIDPSTFGRHVGEYEDPFVNGRFIVTQMGDSLRVWAPELEAAGLDVDPVLQPISSDIFVFTVNGSPLDVTFIPAAPGGDSQFVRNRAVVFTRVPVPPPGLPVPGAATASEPTPTDAEARRARVLAALARAKLEALPERWLPRP